MRITFDFLAVLSQWPLLLVGMAWTLGLFGLPAAGVRLSAATASGTAMAIDLVRIHRQQSPFHACHKQDRRGAWVASRRQENGVRAQLANFRSSA